MGSNNARQVTLHGGWLKPNAYKLLQVMAWRSYDDPIPPEIIEQARAKGEPDPVPHTYYAKIQTSYEEAFGRQFPGRPTRARKDWTEDDHAQERKYQAARQAVKDAVTPLMQASVAERIREGKQGQHTAAYQLHLHRLIDRNPVGNSYPSWEEKPTKVGRKNLPKKRSEVGNPYPSWEEKPTPEEQPNSQTLKHSSSNIQSANSKGSAPNATTLHLGDAHAGDGMPAPWSEKEDDDYQEASQYLQGLPDVGQSHMQAVNDFTPDSPLKHRVIAAALAAGWKNTETREAS